MRKALEITLKDLRVTFGNTNLVLIMFAAPLALASIIGITFGGVMGNASPIEHIKVAVVNQDQGTPLGLSTTDDNTLNYGAIMASLLITGTVGNEIAPGPNGFGSLSIQGMDTADFSCPGADAAAPAAADSGSLDTLLDGTAFDSPGAAREAVASGEYAAAVIIPADFSANMQVSPVDTQVVPTTIELYANPAAPIGAQIVRSVVDQMAAQFATGNVTLAALIASLPDNPLRVASVIASPAFAEGVACAFAGVGTDINVERLTSGGDEVVVNAMVIIGSAQAIFFALFTANGQAGSIIAERRDGTLNRMIVTPTPAPMILLGKIVAVFAVIVVQLLLLAAGLTILASTLSGTPQFIWGTNIAGTVVVLIATAFATAGIGSITAAVAKTEEQANTIGGIVALFMAVSGGAFGFNMPGPIGQLSVIRWGSEALTRLAAGNNDIILHLLVLIAIGAATLGLGFVLFRRQISER